MIRLFRLSGIKKSIKESKESQIVTEFIIMFALLFLFATGFFVVINKHLEVYHKEKRVEALRDVVFTVKQEIINARKSLGNYSREFYLPNKIMNWDYELIMDKGLLSGVLIHESGLREEVVVTSVGNITGEPRKGLNTIRGINGVVCLNC